jgi:hypothetical protein
VLGPIEMVLTSILHHLLNVFVQLANKRGFTKKKKAYVRKNKFVITIPFIDL